MKAEENLQIAVSNYLKMQYPDVIFTSESSGIRLPIGVAKKLKAMRSGSKLPDVIILQPNKMYHGLCLELKKSINEVLKKDGTLRKNEHVEGQAQMIEKLKRRGYYACFACGFDHAKSIIDGYMTETFKNL